VTTIPELAGLFVYLTTQNHLTSGRIQISQITICNSKHYFQCS